MDNETREKKPSGLWRYRGTPGGKFLVLRRDGTVPEWPYFVIGAKDPAAPAAIRAYAEAAARLGWNPDYIADLSRMANEFEQFLAAHGTGDPDKGPHRKDCPLVMAIMRGTGSMGA